jgi:hypothetical protein
MTNEWLHAAGAAPLVALCPVTHSAATSCAKADSPRVTRPPLVMGPPRGLHGRARLSHDPATANAR